MSGHNVVDRSNIAEGILDSVKIPSLPEAAVKLLSLCRDDQVSAGEIVGVVELDPALTTRVLKVANSAAFGQQHRVSTLTRAAVVLGNENLKVVALGFYLSAGWEGMGFAGLDIREFWRDSVIRACLARRLAACADYQPAQTAFLMGMIQDIGTLILGTHFGALYGESHAGVRGNNTRRKVVERAEFGTDAVEVAAALALRWKFPEPLVQSLGRQWTEPPFMRAADPDERLWQIAYFCASVPFAPDRQTARLNGQLRSLAFSALGLSWESMSEVFTDTVEQFNILRGVFSHLIPRGCQVALIMEQAAEFIRSCDVQINE